MSRFIWFLSIVLLSPHTQGLALKVQKVKGKRAIVIFNERGAVEPGDRLSVIEDEGAFAEPKEKKKYTKSITGQFDLESVTYDTGGATDIDASRTAFEGRFGWVKPRFEIGPIFVYQSQKFGVTSGLTTASFDIKTVLIGGYGEYNFDLKDPQFILSGGLILGHASTELGGDASGFRFEPYGRIKYFISRHSGFALLGQLGYRLDQLSGSGQDISGSGFVLKAGMGYYF